ncbi:MAG TPA: bifunctional phosphopantothenoylcysteine decarboxylase/phosphopantothenate--cysteine ligase CoaBC [Acidimicrobiales bacterium]|nr:bifunctional phosphopantothenoylcysteine decarboxylase/phosphopantothenate--cysteine ligase CoaBC [Acidimicrobiales bacterium]
MTGLAGRRVVLAVSGGIAAYKAVELCRRLMDAGATVRPAMTGDATRFVSALTLSAISGQPVAATLWDGPDPIPHTRLGQWAEAVIVAPATARVIGAYAHGISDDLVTATLLATRAPVVVCPAMHTEMWEHPAVQDNISVLRGRGVTVVAPEVGRLAGGDVGAGRLASFDAMVAAVAGVLGPRDLAGHRVLVTAGGTREPIDPVRYIGNRSSGRQGHALAAAAALRGAAVTLVTASDLPAGPGVSAVVVETAEQMATAVLARSGDTDIVIMAAAVADFRPKAAADTKLKKADGVPELVLEPTPDILAALGQGRRAGQVLVGFAAETVSGPQLLAYAADKLRRKHLDLVVANDVSAPGVGFAHDTNAVVIVGADGHSLEVPIADKTAVADAVLDAVVACLARRPRTEELP